MQAEEFFRDAWEIHTYDLDFSKNPEATELYGSENPEAVEHFKYPMQVDEHGEPYTFQEIPLRLFVEEYRGALEDDSLTYPERFESAINDADAGLETEILEETGSELGLF